MMGLFMLPLLWLWGIVQATSIALGPGDPRHLSPVFDLREHGSFQDTLTLDFSIPSDPHLSNMDRRWYVQNDPNARLALGKTSLPKHRDSRALYSYLTRNSSSAEIPGPLNFKVALYPQPQHPLVVNGKIEDDMSTFRGRAFRRIETQDASRWQEVGWARFVVHNSTEGLVYKGSFEVDDELGLGFPSCVYHFTQLKNMRDRRGLRGQGQRDDLDSEYIVWRDFDARESTKTSALGWLEDFGPNNFTFLEGLKGDLLKRDDSNDTTNGASSGVNLYTTVGNTTGCPTRRQVALVGLLADCNYLQNFANMQAVRQHLIDMVAQASRLYEDAFNITLGLSELVIADNSSCPSSGTSEQPWNYACQSDSNALSDRLNNLTSWRISRSNDSLATWSLMTSCNAGSVVGLSWLGAVCQASNQGAVGANVVSYTSLDYLVLAHEIGHSFGAVHDCTSDTCAQGLDKSSQCCPRTSSQCVGSDGQVFVMNPASTEGISAFSACSQGNICSGMLSHSVNTTCLRANTGGLSLYTNNTCGNGIVEEGEECDCGGVDGCGDNSCCDPTTCRFKPGAVCDDSNEECCSQCQFASSSVVCRAASGPCDYAEYCTGNSTGCPRDQFAQDGTSCQLNSSVSGLECMSGHCSSRDLQCQSVMSSLGGTIRACDDDSSCTMSCQSSVYGSNTCVVSSQNFLDGTPCRGSGRCLNGACQGGRSSSPGSGFFGNNGSGGFGDNWKWIVIGVAVFIGACVLAGLLWRTCTTRDTKPYVQSYPPRRANFGPPAPMPAPAPAPAYNDPNFTPVYAAPNYPPPPQPAYAPNNY